MTGMKRKRGLLLGAFTAVALVVTGSALATADALLPRNSVATRQVVNGSLQTSDLSTKARNALRGNRGPRGAPGSTGATGAQGPQGVPGRAATKLFVALNAAGALTKNSGATSAARVNSGVYRIAFNTNITACVYLATAGQDGGSVFENYHLYTSRTGTNTVDVQIFDEKNDHFDRPFYLAVLC